jgi:5-methylcytosine-specific restriction endonuclease McrA
VDELIAATTHRRKAAIELLLAERFPQPDVPARLEVLMPPAGQLAPGPVVSALSDLQLAPAQVGEGGWEHVEASGEQPAARPVERPVPWRTDAPGPRPKLAPLAPERYALQLTVSQRTHDKLRHAQALLSHRIVNGDLAEVLDRVLDLAIEQLEKRRFAATERPRRSRKPSAAGSRRIPAPVQRAVWQRDGGQCTFVSERGHRCPAREHLEFDHAIPVARGGQATVSNVRLRCRAHNQYEAESTFGVEFMNRKRQEARERSEARESQMLAKARAEEIVPGLRHLGFSVDEARRAADFCERMPEASIEERFRAALAYLGPKHLRVGISALVACGPCAGPEGTLTSPVPGP